MKRQASCLALAVMLTAFSFAVVPSAASATLDTGGMSRDEIGTATLSISRAANLMGKIADFAEMCGLQVQLGDTSDMKECSDAMSDIVPVLQGWIDAHPIVDELT